MCYPIYLWSKRQVHLNPRRLSVHGYCCKLIRIIYEAYSNWNVVVVLPGPLYIRMDFIFSDSKILTQSFRKKLVSFLNLFYKCLFRYNVENCVLWRILKLHKLLLPKSLYNCETPKMLFFVNLFDVKEVFDIIKR